MNTLTYAMLYLCALETFVTIYVVSRGVKQERRFKRTRAMWVSGTGKNDRGDPVKYYEFVEQDRKLGE